MGFRNQLKSFIKGEKGAIVVEMALVTPILAFVLYMSYVFFDAYRIKNTAQKATYTIADLLSRRTDGIDEAYMDGMKELFDFLAKTDPGTTDIRVSSVLYKKNKDLYKVKWSYVSGENMSSLTTSELKDYKDMMPEVANKDYLILVETFVNYEPPVQGVVGDQIYKVFTPVSPRFAPHLAWSGS
ncbi:MAG: TadE/TadG family type IV pilus assembly protein [Brevirhabdus sp.]